MHADETSWQVFEDIEDKDGHRWWPWVFVTDATTVFVMDTSRSAGAAAGQLGIDREQTAPEAGRRLVISSDFHKAYQSLACIDGVDLLWCWAHIRRYFLRAGAAHPEALGDWCNEWDGLARHQDLPQLPLDNNAAERALRTPVIGRKNFYGSGARWAAHLAADVWTVTATAARHGIEPLGLLTGYLHECARNGGAAPTGAGLDPFLPWTLQGRASRRPASDPGPSP